MPKNLKDHFVKPNDPVLKLIAKTIPEDQILSPEIQTIIDKMLSVAYGEQENLDKPFLVGLAAPQIGISQKIILVDTKADGKGNAGNLQVFINPEITERSQEEYEWYEGCYSADRVCGIVSRPVSIKFQALNRQGQPVEANLEYYTARIFQHETDHLNGKEFVDLVLAQNPNNLHWVEDDEFVDYRNSQAWRSWPKKCSREKWEQIKGLR